VSQRFAVFASLACSFHGFCLVCVCSVLQCVAVCCNLVLQCIIVCRSLFLVDIPFHGFRLVWIESCDKSKTQIGLFCKQFQNRALLKKIHDMQMDIRALYITHCNTLQHTATHCNILQHTATHYSIVQNSAAHCNTM